MKTDTLYTSIVGGSMAWVAYFVGGVDHLIKAFIIFLAIDYVLGLMVGFAYKNIESKKAFKGLLKKTAMILMVIAAVQLDLATESGNFMRNAMILFLIGMEGISMIENLGKLGIKVPKFLSNAFTQLQIDNDEKKDDAK
ncbi:phage holin family protein [Lysinibacillus varians]|uniref:Phage holin family protein n=1 Tax=Lysinibacillus varians TaxID=1145276 RepID=A0ABY2T616_9BACI|nr:phage holin family protein [Lysinibacillus varians]AHN22034.1 holin [Lysinibacillus varians]TKI52675.1 phage holin family protein [Lysinibacillus varians]